MIPWGTTPEGNFAWSRGPIHGRIFYMIGTKSRLVIRERSHELKSDTGRFTDIGLFQIPDTALQEYEEIQIDATEGGV